MKEEIIGRKMEVTQSRNKDLEGVKGEVVDETKNTFVLDTNKGRKTVLKRGSIFTINNEETDGDLMAMRPEDRVKA